MNALACVASPPVTGRPATVTTLTAPPLVATVAAQDAAGPGLTEASYLASLPVHVRLCAQLFFKLLSSLQSHALAPAGVAPAPNKFAGALRLVAQLPAILSQFPPLSMAAERVRACTWLRVCVSVCACL